MTGSAVRFYAGPRGLTPDSTDEENIRSNMKNVKIETISQRTVA
jgi:hypothetical protein